MKFTHFDDEGNSHMVDVSHKDNTQRLATAVGHIVMHKDTIKHIEEGGIKKGDVLSVAQLAGIIGAKYTSKLIPLCHPLTLTSIKVLLKVEESHIAISATCKVNGKTGVEMEALTAVSITALTVYDMCKAVDKNMYIHNIHLVHKTGGKSGTFMLK